MSASNVRYRDGAEESTLAIVERSIDLSSSSELLEFAASGWAERYHLCRQRSNFLRWLDLSSIESALEVGAGCGAVTRFLGEQLPVVDAVEPVLARAHVAASRCRDLAAVQVFCADVSAIPREPEYDLIIVCGVLEYVGAASSDPTSERETFLGHLRSLLRVGGSIVIAIENQLGVKYLAGAPEDHSGIPFDGVTGYTQSRLARTPSRMELERLCTSLGLYTTVAGAFPDYKLSQVLLMDELFETSDRSALAHRMPHFPSPDWAGGPARVAAEGGVWRTLVSAGLGPQFSNSFVVVASLAEEPVIVRPGVQAVMVSNLRRNRFATLTEVIERDGELFFERHRLHSDDDLPPRDDGLSLNALSSRLIEGRDFTEVFLEVDAPRRTQMLRAWIELIPKAGANSSPGLPVDLLPTNLIVRESGELVAIDQEWFDVHCSREFIILRGLAHLAFWLETRGADGDLVELAELIDLELAESDLEMFLTDEARFQTLVFQPDEGEGAVARARFNAAQAFGLGHLAPVDPDQPKGDRRGTLGNLGCSLSARIRRLSGRSSPRL